MKKEVVIAISIGVFIGLIFTYGIWLANKSLKEAGIAKPTPTPKITEISPTQEPINSVLTINSPVDSLLTNQKSIIVSGTRLPDHTLVILSENFQYILPATTSSKFEQSVSLDAGYNRLKIISIDKDGKLEKIDRLVTYSTTSSLFDDNQSPTPKISPSTTPSGTLRDSVKDKVEKEIAQIKENSSKKAYLGMYSELKDKLTISVDTTIRLLNNSEGSTKDLKSTDYILAMGDADGKDQLNTKRILAINPPTQDTREITLGAVTDFTNKTLTLDKKTILLISKDTVFQPSKYKFASIDPGFKLIAIHTPKSTPLIYVISEK